MTEEEEEYIPNTIERLCVEGAFSIWGEHPSHVNTKTRKRTIVGARAMIVAWLHYEMGYKLKKLALLFGTNPVTPWRLKHEHHRKIEDWPEYGPNYERFKAYMNDVMNPKSVETIEELRLEFRKKYETIETKYNTLKNLITKS